MKSLPWTCKLFLAILYVLIRVSPSFEFSFFSISRRIEELDETHKRLKTEEQEIIRVQKRYFPQTPQKLSEHRIWFNILQLSKHYTHGTLFPFHCWSKLTTFNWSIRRKYDWFLWTQCSRGRNWTLHLSWIEY